VGIDGWPPANNTVEQIGTSQVVLGPNDNEYFAWYEMYPAASIRISNPVQPGDNMNALVTYNVSTEQFTLSIKDTTQNWASNIAPFNYDNQNVSTADWIVEAPMVNGTLAQLANFGSVTFTQAKATINNTTNSYTEPIDGPYQSGVNWRSAAISFLNSYNYDAQEVATSALSDSGSGSNRVSTFTCMFLPSGAGPSGGSSSGGAAAPTAAFVPGSEPAVFNSPSVTVAGALRAKSSSSAAAWLAIDNPEGTPNKTKPKVTANDLALLAYFS